MEHNSTNNDTYLAVGSTLDHGKYRIEKCLASGGFGKTYIAADTFLDTKIVIKELYLKGVCGRKDDGNVCVTLPENQEIFDAQREKFRKEARRLITLRNRHIVRVHNYFEENGTCYYVMDYVRGEGLDVRLKTKGRLTEEEVLHIVPQLLSALGAIHECSLWHLDIKPANILQDANGDVQIIDFGASKQMPNANGEAAETSMILTFSKGYAPPEQLEQNFNKFGNWTDIYALGATLYRLLTRKPLPSPSEIDENPLEALPFPPEISQRTRNLVMWMMQPLRRRRPRNVQEIIDFLDSGEEVVRPRSRRISIPPKKEEPAPATGESRTESPATQPQQPEPQPVQKPAVKQPEPEPVQKPAVKQPEPQPVQKPAVKQPEPLPVQKPAVKQPEPQPEEQAITQLVQPAKQPKQKGKQQPAKQSKQQSKQQPKPQSMQQPKQQPVQKPKQQPVQKPQPQNGRYNPQQDDYQDVPAPGANQSSRKNNMLIGIAVGVFVVAVGLIAFFVSSGGDKGTVDPTPPTEVTTVTDAHINMLDHYTGSEKNAATVVFHERASYTYTGEVNAEGLPHGTGKAVFSSTNTYEGQFENGFLEGQGKWSVDGDVYEGIVHQNQFADGTYKYSDGSTFTGTFKDGLPYTGELRDASGTVTKLKNGQ